MGILVGKAVKQLKAPKYTCRQLTPQSSFHCLPSKVLIIVIVVIVVIVGALG
ncbi:uncharacterized protein BO80DRAFT_424399 [Aspergillus ibericus CBS 121593]|uniref:Uncharacterized protein n=1 Tax=Aspergillus ibericus CBS 121593 TaxID=1448316 RepID=A0A395H299_9EURO|nr:hypothetical protein BO80DRAFT_424399 [Aspergillus ibericus CBS 121593]RAL02022.1 hypothetical protein BO80DRAFT_424399 [Aspergillus ibericus CBS 121593]